MTDDDANPTDRGRDAPTPSPSRPAPSRPAREERLAAALRENLRKRKEQARRRERGADD